MSDDPYRSIVESAQDPIFIADGDGRYLYVNVAAAATLGVTPEQMTGKMVEELFPPHIAAQHRTDIRRVIETGETFKSEDRSEIGGVEMWFSVVLQPLRDGEGRITAVQGIVRDVTSRKQAEEALRESEERLRQVIRASSIGIWDYDLVSRRIYWSPEQRKIWGWGSDEPIGWEEYLNYSHPDDRARVAAAVARVQESDDGLFEVEHRIVRRDGSQRWLTIRGQTFFAGAGAARRPLRAVGATRDITSEKLAAEERVQLQTQLVQAQKLESVGRLAGGVAHDFNNMLNVIIGCADMALVEADHAVANGYLDEILKAAHRSADLTRQLLGFARRQPMTPRLLDVNDFISASLKMLRRLIGEHVDLVWRPAAGVWPVRIDPTQVEQILVNLIANARNAIADVGTVVISTDNVTIQDSALYDGLPRGEYVMIDVADTGRGMDAETQRHIFEPFYTTEAAGPGAGLGLASVHGIVTQNDGVVTVSSDVGRGTMVKVFLPRVAGVAAVEGDALRGAHRTGTETILVVEDEPTLLRLATRALEIVGYTVLSAATPAEAMRIASVHADAIDMLVTDVVMPGMNGFTLAERLVERQPNLKCLFMSGYPTDVMARGGVLDEHVNFLPKPFSAKGLSEKVRQVLGMRA